MIKTKNILTTISVAAMARAITKEPATTRDWRPLRPKLEWTDADERRYQAKTARQDEADAIKSVGQVALEWAARNAEGVTTPGEAVLAWAFRK